MLVKELIEQLQKQNPEAPVFNTNGYPIIAVNEAEDCGCCNPLNVLIESEF